MLSGSVTRQKACQRLAPRSLAASSSRRSRLSSETKIGSATNGNPDVDQHEHDRELAVEELRDGIVGSPQPRPEEERVDDAVAAEDHLPGEHAQQVAREEGGDEQEEQDVLPLRPRAARGSTRADRRAATTTTETISDIFTDFQNSAGRSSCRGSRASRRTSDRCAPG